MAKGVNKVIIIGNLGIDPVIRTGADGLVVANFSVATTSYGLDKSSGERKEYTEWHKIVCFKKAAEFVRDYIRKGNKVYIEGSLRTREWVDKENLKHTVTEILAGELQSLTAKPSHDEPAKTVARATVTPTSDFDDDIPF